MKYRPGRGDLEGQAEPHVAEITQIVPPRSRLFADRGHIKRLEKYQHGPDGMAGMLCNGLPLVPAALA